MDLESCPEQISDKVFQDEHSALPGQLKGWWMVNGGEGVGVGKRELGGGNFGSQMVTPGFTMLEERQEVHCRSLGV